MQPEGDYQTKYITPKNTPTICKRVEIKVFKNDLEQLPDWQLGAFLAFFCSAPPSRKG